MESGPEAASGSCGFDMVLAASCFRRPIPDGRRADIGAWPAGFWAAGTRKSSAEPIEPAAMLGSGIRSARLDGGRRGWKVARATA